MEEIARAARRSEEGWHGGEQWCGELRRRGGWSKAASGSDGRSTSGGEEIWVAALRMEKRVRGELTRVQLNGGEVAGGGPKDGGDRTAAKRATEAAAR